MAIAVAPVVFERVTDTAGEFRGRPGEIRFVELPSRLAVMIDGEGRPDSERFAPRMPGLYATAFGLRFALKRRGVETHVRPLEGLWWTASGENAFDTILGEERADWRWTLLIVLPDEAREAELREALGTARLKLTAPFAASLRVERFEEGRAAQVIHLGPYDRERPTIERLHSAIGAAGLRPRGRHHEIYLGDPRRSASDRLRTLIRQPVG